MKKERSSSQSANAPWGELIKTMRLHVADHGVDLAADQVTLSEPLQVDEKAERFTVTGSERANEWGRREYREGFVVG